MKICKLFALLAAMCLLLTGCEGTQMLEELLQQYAAMGNDRSAYEAMVPFDQIEYVRPDLDEIRAQAKKATAMLTDGSSESQVIAALDACNVLYYRFDTMYTLADIRACQNTADAYYAREYAQCMSDAALVDQIYSDLYSACANSAMAKELEDDYFGEGFVDAYGGDYAGYPDELVALMQQESDLISQYRAVTADATVEYGGKEVSYDELYADMTMSDDQWLQVQTAYYDKYAPTLGNIYIQMVKVRNQMATFMGYDGYEDYAYECVYGRDYTPRQTEKLLEQIRQHLAPVYAGLQSSGAIDDMIYTPLTEDALMARLAKAAQGMGGDIWQAWQFMKQYGLYDVSVSSTKAPMSFEDYLDSYEAPYLFVDAQGDTTDLLSVGHEFGHYVDAYVNYDTTYSIETAEVFSQSMEFLLLCALQDENLTKYKLLDVLDTYAQQGSFAEFEHQVYALPEDELTVERINEISLQTSKDFGYCEEGWEDCYAKSWIDIPHFFEYPFYVISYCVSNDAAVQIYQMECKNQGDGLKEFETLLPRNYDGFLDTVVKQGGLKSPFDDGRMEETAQLVRQFFLS